MITINNHLHSCFSGDAEGSLEAIVKEALRCGIEQITVTDHAPAPKGFSLELPDCNMKDELVSEYLGQTSGEIDLGIGLEIDYFEDYEPVIPELDFALGAVHVVKDICFDFSPGEFERASRIAGGVKKLYSEYFRLLNEAIVCGKFDCVAHLDLIKKFNANEKYFSEKEDEYVECIVQTLDNIAEEGIAMEINTAGLFKLVSEIYPSPWIVKEALERGIDISVGSDSHTPRALCQGYDRAEQVLKSAGCKEVCYFRERKRKSVPLTP